MLGQALHYNADATGTIRSDAFEMLKSDGCPRRQSRTGLNDRYHWMFD